MTDIVERLRELSALEKSFPMSGTCWYEKAADEIERLREWNREIGINAKFYASEVERLKEALRPFADIAKLYVNDTDHEVTDNIDKWEFCVPFPNLRKAYEALQENEND